MGLGRSAVNQSILLVASCSWAATLVIDISVAGRAPLVPAMYHKVTHYYSANGTELTVIKATDNFSKEDIAALQPLVNDQVITSAFETVAKITEVVCMTAGPIACVTTGIIAVLGVFFALYQLGGRELSDHLFNLEYPPVPGCGARCRLELDAPEGDWRPVGNATINGVFHSIHYKRNGTYHGLRSIQFTSGEDFVKRAEDNDGGVIVDYNWSSTSETAYDSFHSTSSMIDGFATDMVDDLQDANSIQGCCEFEDSDGLLDGGLISIGWNNQPFEFEDGQEQALVDDCEAVGGV